MLRTTRFWVLGLSLGLAHAACGAPNPLSLNFGAEYQSMDDADAAGAVAVTTFWNNLTGGSGSNPSLNDSTGIASGIAVTWSGFEAVWHGDNGLANGHEKMMYGYADNFAGGVATVALSNITWSAYDVYAYFGSDSDERYGNIRVDGQTTFYYQSFSGSHPFPASYVQTTYTGGVDAETPQSNFAVWSNLTASSFVLTFTANPFGNSGLHGLQIVPHGSGSVDTPFVNNGPATDITPATAWLSGTLVSTGNAPTSVWLYWGAADGETNAAAWSHAASFGTRDPGILGTNVVGLSGGTLYYYRYYATNAFGEDWAASSATFATAPSPAIIGPTNYISINFGANEQAMASNDVAGAVVALANWNNLAGAIGSVTSLVDSTGAPLGITVTWGDFEAIWHSGNARSNGDELMMYGYCDNTVNGGSASVTISGITATNYDVYAYFGADSDNRDESIRIVGAETFHYRTYSGTHSFPASYIRTTDTLGTTPLFANYAVWTDLTEPTFTMVLDPLHDGAGLHGLQLVLRNNVVSPPTGFWLWIH